MHRHGVEGHVDGARGQADQAALFALEQHEREHVGRREDQGDDRAHERAAGHVAELALGGALDQGGGGHEGPNEEDGEPRGDEDVVHDQGHGCGGQEADEAGAILLEVGDAEDEHQGKDAKVRDDEEEVDAVELGGENDKAIVFFLLVQILLTVVLLFHGSARVHKTHFHTNK